ncbi:YdcF family protein [Hoyosella rhizosphaerae]|nr:YdcF family protein [Hoyosella rhizosphaerae]
MVVGAASSSTPSGTVSVINTATTADVITFYNSAQSKFARHDAVGGLADIKRALTIDTTDVDSLQLQVIWAEQVDDTVTRDAALRTLDTVDPSAAQTARNVIAGVDAAAQIVPSTDPVEAASVPVAIVILGHGLRPDGSMQPELVKRLTAGLAQAITTPNAPIVVTGGSPQQGITEAAAMTQWLVEHGVPRSRILVEDQSVSTVANAQNTTKLLSQQGISEVILVTSPSHVRRAAANFAATGTRFVGTVTTDTDLDKFLVPYTKAQHAGIRLEATRAAGIPATKKHSTDVISDLLGSVMRFRGSLDGLGS